MGVCSWMFPAKPWIVDLPERYGCMAGSRRCWLLDDQGLAAFREIDKAHSKKTAIGTFQ